LGFYEVTDALHIFFSSSFKISVNDFGCSSLLFSDKMSINLALWFSLTARFVVNGQA
jgi:hypothetical protein